MFFKFCNKSYRKKFGDWQKKLDKLEALQLEFEVAFEKDSKLEAFNKEISDKLEHMCNFKKTYQKFQLQLDKLLAANVCLCCLGLPGVREWGEITPMIKMQPRRVEGWGGS